MGKNLPLRRKSLITLGKRTVPQAFAGTLVTVALAASLCMRATIIRLAQSR